ncbi:MAG: hypothetical protein CMO55_24955 [Verrucomicrobiales bacterium]|nr:hypothetical protein [Verrucomicrobiales bacterium]
MKIRFASTLLRLVAILTSVILIPESLLFLGLMTRNVFRFAQSISADGPPSWYFLLFAVGQTAAAVLCWMGCRMAWRRLEVTNRRLLTGCDEEERTRISAKKAVSKFLLFVGFVLFAFVLAPIIWWIGVISGHERTAGWLVGVPIVIACCFYLAFLFFPHRRK